MDESDLESDLAEAAVKAVVSETVKGGAGALFGWLRGKLTGPSGQEAIAKTQAKPDAPSAQLALKAQVMSLLEEVRHSKTSCVCASAKPCLPAPLYMVRKPHQVFPVAFISFRATVTVLGIRAGSTSPGPSVRLAAISSVAIRSLAPLPPVPRLRWIAHFAR
jgi:hypothetical protein